MVQVFRYPESFFLRVEFPAKSFCTEKEEEEEEGAFALLLLFQPSFKPAAFHDGRVVRGFLLPKLSGEKSLLIEMVIIRVF